MARGCAKAAGRSVGTFDIMIAVHTRALGATPVTSDKAIANLRIVARDVILWSGKQ